jgi:tripartite ATP-independent transporter DctP family solute receptor
MITRRTLAGFGVSALAAGCSRRQGRELLTAADVQPEGHPTVLGVEWMGQELERLTSGRISIRHYPSSQLGSEDDSIGLARFGAIDICRVAVAALNNAFPQTRLWALPYVFRSTEHTRAVVDGPVGTELLNVFEGRGLVGLAYYDAAPRCFYNARHPVTGPEDLKGLKIRAPQSDIFLEMIRAMGANPTPLTFGIVFSSLQTRLIDGAENNWPSYQSSRQFEVAPHWTQSEHSYSPDALLISREALDRFSAPDRDLIRDVARRSVAVMRQAWDKRSDEARAQVLAKGVKITQADKAAFARSVEPVLAKYLKDPTLRRLHDAAAVVAG